MWVFDRRVSTRFGDFSMLVRAFPVRRREKAALRSAGPSAMKERRPSRSNARAGPGPSCDTQPGREILPPGEGTSDNAKQKAETELPVHAPHLRNRTPAESRPDLSTLRPVGSPAFTHGAGEPTRSRPADPLLLPASSPVETGRRGRFRTMADGREPVEALPKGHLSARPLEA